MSSSVNFADLMAFATRVSGIRRQMSTNFFFFAGSTVHPLDAMANNTPRWIGNDMRCEGDKVNRSMQFCNLA
jgi:hypothetical protein